MGLVFVDTETTGLADRCDIWEIGLINRTGEGDDVEYRWLIRPDLTNAEPTGLRIGRYYERIGDLCELSVGAAKAKEHPDQVKSRQICHAVDVAAEVARLLDGATIVGAVPDFDARHLTQFLRGYGHCGTWHYHLVDVETLTAGALRIPPPWNFDDLLARVGLVYDEADRHTALGDARMVRDLYDQVMFPAPHGGDR